MRPINFDQFELDTVLIQWLHTVISTGLLSITVIGPSLESAIGELAVLAQHPPYHLGAARALLDWLAAESRAADFPTNASFSPLVSWQVLSDQIQEGEVASPVVATWVEAWQYFGAKAFMRLRFPIVAGRSFEVFLFCRADRLDRSTQSMLVWSALSLWPNIKRLIASAISPLSRRELQCLQLSFEGLSAYKVGLRLGITDRTVNFHIANAMAKLKAQNKLEAVRRACWLGVL